MTALIVSAAVVVAALLGWPITALVLRMARNAAAVTAKDAADVVVLPDGEPGVLNPRRREPAPEKLAPEEPENVLRGGLTIGILERIAVVLCIVFDQPAAIAYAVAIKGLGRYPELKESPAASERFIIGTLASLIWAALIGVLGRWLLGLVG